MTKLYRSNCFESVDLQLKDFVQIKDIKELWVGREVYWKYSGKIVTKGMVTHEDQGYICDFINLIKRGVIYVKKNAAYKL